MVGIVFGLFGLSYLTYKSYVDIKRLRETNARVYFSLLTATMFVVHLLDKLYANLSPVFDFFSSSTKT